MLIVATRRRDLDRVLTASGGFGGGALMSSMLGVHPTMKGNHVKGSAISQAGVVS